MRGRRDGHSEKEHNVMRKPTSTAKRLIASVTVAGALTTGVVGLAGVAGATTTSTTVSAAAQAHHNAVCTRAKKRHVKRMESGASFSKRATKLRAEAAKAKAAGHQQRAAYLTKLADQNQATASRLGTHHTKAEARLSAEAAKACSSS
jgi:hypothetical protein